jgi:chromosome transmission fidelity protein 1
VVPGGLVIFLPSYDYEDLFYKHLKTSGFLEKIEAKKKVRVGRSSLIRKN